MTELQASAKADSAQAGELATFTYPTIALQLLVPGKYQPRTIFNPSTLQELAENIKAMGVMQPILIRRLPADRVQATAEDRRPGEPLPTHEIVAGERRYRASKLAGLKTIPYIERELTDAQVAHMALAENVQREDLHPLEEAKAYRNILDLPEEADRPMSERIARLAGEIKKSGRYIYQTLQFLKLCEFAQQVFLAKKMDKTVALEIATIGNEAQQIEATRHCAGLSRQGMDVVQHPLSLRAAAEYVESNFRLLLKKAAFPIKVEFAGIGPCTSCTTMSANARELYPEDANVPDTCMDPSCYGKKNTAHYAAAAEAAKKEGQRVITGKEAKKLLPYEGSSDSLPYNSDYESIDHRRYEGKCDGKTVKQLLGKDMPKPVLIQRPDGQGFVEALPKKDVERLLKEKGLLQATRSSNPNAEQEKKAKAIKAYRAAVAEQLLAAADTWGTPIVTPADGTDCNALVSKLLLPMGIQLYRALDNESSKRLCKLVGWEPLGRWGDRKTLSEKLQAMDGVAFNRYVVSALIAGELSVATWGTGGRADAMEDLAEILGVDSKKVKADLEKAQKEAEKAKKTPKGKKATANAPAAKPAAPAKKASGKPAAIATDDTPVAITRWRLATMEDVPQLQAGARVRILNERHGSQRLPENRIQHQGHEGALDTPAGPEAWYVKLTQAGSKPTSSLSFHITELMLPAGEITRLELGMPVRFKQGLKGGTHNRKCSGRAGVIAELCGAGVAMVRCEGFNDLYRADPGELEAFEDDKAPPAAPAAKKAANAPAKAKNPATKPQQLQLGQPADLDQPRTPITPAQAWPFPPAKKAEAA